MEEEVVDGEFVVDAGRRPAADGEEEGEGTGGSDGVAEGHAGAALWGLWWWCWGACTRGLMGAFDVVTVGLGIMMGK